MNVRPAARRGDRVQPTAAERARSVLEASASLTVLWDGGRADLVGCHRADEIGDVVIRPEPDGGLARAASAAAATGDDLTVALELTDLAPLPLPDRVRARLTLGGWLSVRPGRPGQPPVLVVDVAEVLLAADDPPLRVDLDEYREVDPDCLAAGEAAQLQHLAAHHPEAVALLGCLAGPELMRRTRRAVPLAMDRYGLVLRLDGDDGLVDVRLPFRVPVRDAAEAGEALRHLLAAAAAD